MTSVSTFDSTKTDLLELLGDALSGEAQLPDFQRGWVWDDVHIRDLIASVSRSFPIGTVMLLETGGEVSFRTRPIEGAVLPDPKVPDQLVLDGQQRMTSLFQALMSGKPVVTKDTKQNEIERWYYLDIALALDPNADREDAVKSVPADRMVRTNFGRDIELDLSIPAGEYEAHLFPLARVFDHYEWASGYREHHGYDADLSKRWDEFEKEVISRFKGYQLPVIRLHKETPKEAVCLVFEKVNTGGVSLTVFELLTATFAAVAPPEFELRADWDARRTRMHAEPVLREVASTDFLQVISLLATRARREASIAAGTDEEKAPAISCKRRDMLRMTYDDYVEWAEPVTQAFDLVARFLHRERIFETKFLPYGSQLVPLAAFLSVVGEPGIENAAIRAKLARWYWCGVLGEMYGSATETRFSRDLPDLLDWMADDAAVPRSVQDANFAPDRLDRLTSRRSAAYKGLYVLLIREGAEDFRTGEAASDQNYFDEQVDIHHIFPKKWCNERTPEPVPASVFNSIINRTPLTKRTNIILGGRAPSEYLERLRDKHDVSEDLENRVLRSHLIDPERLRADDFEGFFEARRDALLRAIEKATGKPVLMDTAEPGTPSDAMEDDDDA